VLVGLNFWILLSYDEVLLCDCLQEESEQEPLLDDAREMLPGKAYHWRDWCICRGRDCLYIWSDAAALELSNGSNGWFRFILDGKLATMYSSGSPEGGTDSSGKCCNCL
jgi:E3 ubiquitin-protein ligase HECTD1